MIVYGFHPFERFSIDVGKKLGQNPPEKTDVVSFTPSTIKPDYLRLSWKERAVLNYKGAKELRNYALNRYEELPFIIELHDTPLYAGFWGHEFDQRYWLMYPRFNKKLGIKLKEFKQQLSDKKVDIVRHEMQISPGYHSLTIESWPVHYREGGTFEVLTVAESEKFVRDVVDFLQK